MSSQEFFLFILLILTLGTTFSISYYLHSATNKRLHSALVQSQHLAEKMCQLAAASDLQAYVGLQSLNQETTPNQVPDLSDAATAMALAEAYQKQGIDPALAFDEESLGDFGIPGVGKL